MKKEEKRADLSSMALQFYIFSITLIATILLQSPLLKAFLRPITAAMYGGETFAWIAAGIVGLVIFFAGHALIIKNIWQRSRHKAYSHQSILMSMSAFISSGFAIVASVIYIVIAYQTQPMWLVLLVFPIVTIIRDFTILFQINNPEIRFDLGIRNRKLLFFTGGLFFAAVLPLFATVPWYLAYLISLEIANLLWTFLKFVKD